MDPGARKEQGGQRQDKQLESRERHQRRLMRLCDDWMRRCS